MRRHNASRQHQNRRPFTVPLPDTNSDRCLWVIDHDQDDPETALIRREAGEPDDEPDEEEAVEIPPIERLSVEEQTAVTMYYEDGYTQQEIGDAMGISKVMVAYHLHRAAHRLRWMLGPGSWFSGVKLFTDVSQAGMPEEQALVLQGWWESTSQSVAGERLGWRQGRARHHIWRGRQTLEELAQVRTGFRIYVLGFVELETWGQNAIKTEGRPQRGHQAALRTAGPPTQNPASKAAGRTPASPVSRVSARSTEGSPAGQTGARRSATG